jgi:hypothetical protein
LAGSAFGDQYNARFAPVAEDMDKWLAEVKLTLNEPQMQAIFGALLLTLLAINDCAWIPF